MDYNIPPCQVSWRSFRTDVDGRLVFAGLASFVFRSERGPVEGPVVRTIPEGTDLDCTVLTAGGALEHGQSVKTCCGSRRGEEEGLEKHVEKTKCRDDRSQEGVNVLRKDAAVDDGPESTEVQFFI